MQHGIYHNMPRAEYDAIDAINQSTLKAWGEYGLGECPASFKWHQENPKDKEAFLIGRALDVLAIEGEEAFTKGFKVYNGTRRGKEWNEFKELNIDMEILTGNEMDEVCTMRNILHYEDKKSGEWAFGRCHKAVFVTELCGELVKGEVDLFSSQSRIVRDLKTTRDNSKEFVKDAYNMGYHIQAAFYLDALQSLGEPVEQFNWITILNKEPFTVRRFYAHIESPLIEHGRRRYRELMASYVAALKENKWPGYEGITELTLPGWVK
jgi:hypothetical protein